MERYLLVKLEFGGESPLTIRAQVRLQLSCEQKPLDNSSSNNWSLWGCFDDTVGDGLNQCVIATGNHQDSDSLRGAPPRRPDPKSDLDGRILG
ncbi:MAG: hypothetical protein IJ960_08575, partial [Oscillospiraceae bacterium]|nr:hypothetical protein [Oscillospiraceae bacterium]